MNLWSIAIDSFPPSNSQVALTNCLMTLIQVEDFQDHLMMVIPKLQISMLEISRPRFDCLPSKWALLFFEN